MIETARPVVLTKQEIKLKRKQVLEKAIEIVCDDRETQYGNPENNFAKIAGLWSSYLDHIILPRDVAVMMILLKISRVSSGVQKDDNWVDISGYAACGAELEEWGLK